MSHVTLVRPPMLVSKNTLQGPITPPINIAYLAASLVEKGHTVTIVDAVGSAPKQVTPLFDGKMLGIGLSISETVERIPHDTNLVGVSAMFSGEWPYVRRLIVAIKKAMPNIPIVGGGEHFTAVPEFSLESCPELDYCVLGEGEETLAKIADRLGTPEKIVEVDGLAWRSDNQVVRTSPSKRITQVDDLPWPAWDLVPLENYLSQGLGYGVNRGRSMAVIATRGCPYQCTFCSSSFMWTRRWVAREPELVLEEIEHYIKKYGATNMDFYDLTAITRKDWIIQFCHLILERGLKFTWQLPSGTRSEAIDKEVSVLLYAAGCRNMSYAPESGSPATLRRIKKEINLARMLVSMRGSVSGGLNLKTNIIFGFPDETRWEIFESIIFLVRMAWVGVQDVSISMFSPYPGSELFMELRKRGRLPELTDEYFLSLASYTDVTETASWSEKVSATELGFLRIIGLAAFYGVQYALRPWRLIRSLFNLVSKRQESRLDKSLQDYLQRGKG